MIQALAIFLVVALFLHDAYLQGFTPELTPALLATWFALKLALALLYLLACRHTHGRLRRNQGSHNLRNLDRITLLYLLSVAISYAGDLATGMLGVVRDRIGDHVILDELVVMLLPIVMLCWAWWAFYPIDRFRKRHAPVEASPSPDVAPPAFHTPPTRLQFVIYQLRLQLAIILVPLLFMLAIRESVNFLHEAYPRQISPLLDNTLHFAGIGCVLLFAPVALRYIWDTAPLPPGPLRDRLLTLCKNHRVGVRQLLIWKTYGAMINGAVMGLIAPLRFILLTDSLIERLPQSQVEAVMAHELAHVKRGHILWLFLTTAGTLSLLTLIVNTIVWFVTDPADKTPIDESDPLVIAVSFLTMVFIMGTWVAVFGWVSRQFERQADTFAVQHNAAEAAGTDPGAHPTASVVITDNAARTMIDALENVAALNYIPPKKRSWRHGSIRWRQMHLQGLVGQRTDQLRIDRTVRRIKFATSAIILAMIVVSLIQYWEDSKAPKDSKAILVEQGTHPRTTAKPTG